MTLRSCHFFCSSTTDVTKPVTEAHHYGIAWTALCPARGGVSQVPDSSASRPCLKQANTETNKRVTSVLFFYTFLCDKPEAADFVSIMTKHKNERFQSLIWAQEVTFKTNKYTKNYLCLTLTFCSTPRLLSSTSSTSRNRVSIAPDFPVGRSTHWAGYPAGPCSAEWCRVIETPT